MTPDAKLIQDIGAAKNSKDLLRAMGEYCRAADANGEQIKASIPVALACRDGCAFCCYIPVGARAQEIFLLADFIRSHFSPDQQSALIARLRTHFSIVSPITKEAQNAINIPCPLLDGSRCSVYSARPLACRGHHSLDVSYCQYSFEHPEDAEAAVPQPAELKGAWMTMTGLANGAFAHHGYDQTGYELGSALLEALTNPATLRRFHRRKKAFPNAKQNGHRTSNRNPTNVA